MTNPYFTSTGNPTTQNRYVSANLREQFTRVEQGFDILAATPTISGALYLTQAYGHTIGIAPAAFNADVGLYIAGSFTGTQGATSGGAVGLGMNPIITAQVNWPAYGLLVGPGLNKAGSGTHSEFVSAIVTPPTIGAGAATLTNAATFKVTNKPSGATNNYGLWLANNANAYVESAGPHAIGTAIDPLTAMSVAGSFTSAAYGVGWSFFPTITATGANGATGYQAYPTVAPGVGTNGYGAVVSNTFTKAGSGTHAKAYNYYVGPVTISGGAATVTTSASLAIQQAPTGATNNYSLLVEAGPVNFAGTLKVSSQIVMPAGGLTGEGVNFSNTANFGVFFGSGAPTLAAAKGSLYLRSDGSGVNNRAYINTDGATTWTAVTTVA